MKRSDFYFGLSFIVMVLTLQGADKPRIISFFTSGVAVFLALVGRASHRVEVQEAQETKRKRTP